MYYKYKLDKIKRDFMGYNIGNPRDISFHHLIVAKRYCKQQGLGNGYFERNGALLVQHTSHDYLHVVEMYDRDMFDEISSEMIDENLKGYLDEENFKAIDDVLQCFEREHCGDTTNKGRPLIKPEYVEQRLVRKR